MFFAYSTVTGFHYDVSSIGRSSVPFLTMADHYLGGVAVLAWVAGIVSVLATLVSGTNSQARMLFDGGRTGLLPAWLGRLRPQVETPVNALLAMAAVGLGIIGVWWLSHLLTGNTGSMDPVGLYAECSTMGTIVILFVYLLTTLSLPFFMWHRHRQLFSVFRHVAIPVLDPSHSSCRSSSCASPVSPAPYSVFPFVALAIVAMAVAIAFFVLHRHPLTGTREGKEFSGA